MPENLPLVLAGPIVRRVEPTNCSFWVALSEPADVEVMLWQGLKFAGSSIRTVDDNTASFAQTSAIPLKKFGEHLYIGVITMNTSIHALSDLIPGQIYSYDIIVTPTLGGGTLGLRQLNLLEDETTTPEEERLPGVDKAAPGHLALGYDTNRLPSFVAVAGQASEIRLAHASCRKPHGPSIDALGWLDDQIQINLDDNKKRVQQLFLTGDQIYADDVAAALLPMLNKLGRDVLGTRKEQLPVDDTLSFEATIENFPALRRSRLVRNQAKFTSSAADSHLMSFGEYVGMYLAVWSPRVWRALAGEDEVFIPPPDDADLLKVLNEVEKCQKSKDGGASLTDDEAREKWKEASFTNFKKNRNRVKEFCAVVPKVARALANTSTLMIFDDHEITDDWNLNQRWRRQVFSTALGKSIIRNGMMAYGIFQGWGNDPASFSDAGNNNGHFISEVQEVLGTASATTEPIPVGPTDELDRLIGSTVIDDQVQARWDYFVSGPSHRVQVLDTRTRRRFRGGEIAPADLLGNSLERQVPTGPLTDGREVLIVVSPVPVVGPEIIEQIGAPLFELIGDFQFAHKVSKEEDPCHPGRPELGVEKADAESWSGDEAAREAFLARLATHGKTVILSGDVHYSVSLRLDYWEKQNESSIPIIQLTSSASHNSFESRVEFLLRRNALLQQYQEGLVPEILAWNERFPLGNVNQLVIPPGKRSRMRREPAILPSRGWPAGTEVPPGNPPDWRWRLQLIVDQRTDEEMPMKRPDLPALEEPDLDAVPDSARLDVVRAIAVRHQVTALNNEFLLLRRMVFTTNIGLVDIFTEPGEEELKVRHTLISQAKDGLNEGVENTVHVTPLSATTEPSPILQTED